MRGCLFDICYVQSPQAPTSLRKSSFSNTIQTCSNMPGFTLHFRRGCGAMVRKMTSDVPGGSRYRTNTPTLGLVKLRSCLNAPTPDEHRPRSRDERQWCHKYLKSNSRPNVGVFVRYLLPPGTHRAIFVVLERFEVRIRVLDTVSNTFVP